MTDDNFQECLKKRTVEFRLLGSTTQKYTGTVSNTTPFIMDDAIDMTVPHQFAVSEKYTDGLRTPVEVNSQADKDAYVNKITALGDLMAHNGYVSFDEANDTIDFSLASSTQTVYLVRKVKTGYLPTEE